MHCLPSPRLLFLALSVSIGVTASWDSPLMAQETIPSDQMRSDSTELDPEQEKQIKLWIEQLGSKEFAERERAACALMDVGLPILPTLHRLSDQTTDPEVRLRTEQIIRQMTRGDMQTRIDSFLAGGDDKLDGWPVVSVLMGDTGATRELFIELLKSHPELMTSLDGTPRDRVVAMEKVIADVKERKLRSFPTRADTVALMLPIVDPNVPVTAALESELLSALNKQQATKLRSDAQLGIQFRSLTERWLLRSTLSSRNEALMLGMAWDLEGALPLAVQTLGEANEPRTLAVAMQAISRFGGRQEVERVQEFLDDKRPAAEPAFANGVMLQSELRDVAMATIAVLYEVPLTDAGFGEIELHPTYGIILSDIGFPVEDEKIRKEVRAKIDELLETSKLSAEKKESKGS